MLTFSLLKFNVVDYKLQKQFLLSPPWHDVLIHFIRLQFLHRKIICVSNYYFEKSNSSSGQKTIVLCKIWLQSILKPVIFSFLFWICHETYLKRKTYWYTVVCLHFLVYMCVLPFQTINNMWKMMWKWGRRKRMLHELILLRRTFYRYGIDISLLYCIILYMIWYLRIVSMDIRFILNKREYIKYKQGYAFGNDFLNWKHTFTATHQGDLSFLISVESKAIGRIRPHFLKRGIWL